MKTSNNPAGRLHSLLVEGKGQDWQDKSISKVWAKILEVPYEDKGLLLRRVGQVMALPSSIKEAMSHIDDIDHNMYLRWLPQVESSFSTLNFDMQWKNFIGRFDGEIMYGIEICSDRLSRERPEKTVNEEHLASLSEKVNELLSELDRTELSGNAWLYIHDHLVRVKEAIEEYRIRGIKPLESALHEVVGSVVLSPEIYQESQRTQKGKRFWEIMGKLAIILTITVSSVQIGKDIVSILPPPETEDKANEKNITGQSDSESN